MAIVSGEDAPSHPVVMLSQYVELRYVADLLDSAGGTGTGYLREYRVSHVTVAEDHERVDGAGKQRKGFAVRAYHQGTPHV